MAQMLSVVLLSVIAATAGWHHAALKLFIHLSMVQMLSVVLLSLIAAAAGRPQLPADVSEAQCPNFPYCAPTAQDLSVFTPAQQVITT